MLAIKQDIVKLNLSIVYGESRLNQLYFVYNDHKNKITSWIQFTEIVASDNLITQTHLTKSPRIQNPLTQNH